MGATVAKVSVGIIEDHPTTRVGLQKVIVDDPSLDLVAAVGSIEDFELQNVRPDVIILDLRLRGGGMDGPDAVRRLCSLGWSVLVLSMFDEEVPVLEAVAAGADGYLTKIAEPSEIVQAVKVVAEGRTYFSATVAGFLLKERVRLTNREMEVLRLVAGGETTAEIARQLYITEKTVNGHLERIRNKTGRRRRPDLTRLAYERGILPRG
jgi:DNA-binding NarL/FixJ family response regulator